VSNLSAAKKFIHMCSNLKEIPGSNTLTELYSIFTTCVGFGVQACSNHKFKTVDFKDFACALMGCSRTNIVESFNFVMKSIGAPTFARVSFELYNIQVHQLLSDLAKYKLNHFTTTGTFKLFKLSSIEDNIGFLRLLTLSM